jgi:hypothetical protein
VGKTDGGAWCHMTHLKWKYEEEEEAEENEVINFADYRNKFGHS